MSTQTRIRRQGWTNSGVYHYGSPEQRRAQPQRQGARWTDDETQAMLMRLFHGVSIAQVARAHQRSVGAIDMRLSRCETTVPPVVEAAQ